MPLGQPVLYAVYAAVQAVAGAIIVWHYPRHPVGWLLAAFDPDATRSSATPPSPRSPRDAEGWPGAIDAEIAGLSSWIFGGPVITSCS